MTVGILGCEPGAGVTHLCIALANYCASKLQKTTACLELCSPGELSALSPEHNPAAVQKNGICDTGFSIYGVDYYPAVQPDLIPTLFNTDYCYLILDMGYADRADWNEFLRCDRKLIVGSLAPWKTYCYESLFCNYSASLKNNRSFVYLVQTGDKWDIAEFAEKHRIAMKTVPFISNPFQIEKERFLFLQELL